MRYYFENRNHDKSAGLKSAAKYSYENIGNLIKDTLNGN